jgi:hypothetical protein
VHFGSYPCLYYVNPKGEIAIQNPDKYPWIESPTYWSSRYDDSYMWVMGLIEEQWFQITDCGKYFGVRPVIVIARDQIIENDSSVTK